MANHTERIRLRASIPFGLVLERLANRTRDLEEEDLALASIVAGSLSSMNLVESC